MNTKLFFCGLLIAFIGISIIVAVFMVPITREIRVKRYEKREKMLHVAEDVDVRASTYMVSAYIERGRNVYVDVSANASFTLYVLPLEDWNASIREGREYSGEFVKYIDFSEVNAYFYAPDTGYYIFEIWKMKADEGLRIGMLRINSVWTELVEVPAETDYNYNVITWGWILAAAGFIVALYEVLPRQAPPGIMKR